MKSLPLNTPLLAISGVGPKFLAKLKKLNIETVRDLLWHFPSRYEDYSRIYSIADLQPNQQATIRGVVQDISSRRSFRRRMTIIEATVSDGTDCIAAIWFNQPYIQTSLAEGVQFNFSGKISVRDGIFSIVNPAFERSASATRHTAGIIPIYPETRGLTSKGFRYLIQPILNQIAPEEFLPEIVLKEKSFPEIHDALRAIHFPHAISDASRARERFAFEDLFLLHLFNLHQKTQLSRAHAPSIPAEPDTIKKFLKLLPFELTLSQKKSLWEIAQDIGQPHPMNRLLQGDVGSGKTIVAILAALMAARHNVQTAFMAPTEVLAHQHFETLSAFFDAIPDASVPFCLLTGKTAHARYENNLSAELSKAALLKAISSGEIRIVIGTHSLIQKAVRFKKLGLVVIDEQHRFGVKQRATFTRNANDIDAPSTSLQKPVSVPHFLSMSATPIPRTIMLTAFGDLDVSTITELPRGRKKIITRIVGGQERKATYEFIRKEIHNGRQAFVICPRIEPPEDATPEEVTKLEMKNVTEEYNVLSKTIFPNFRVDMLHGKMPARGGSALGGKASKESVMDAFRKGEIQILVSTSVIEVGIDVPNATIMMIEGAERFGLAQLYQFRGRVGRDAHQSYCFLLTSSNSAGNSRGAGGGAVQQRLQAILEAKNGFELAEKDLEIRGPGEFLGRKQAGMPDMPMRNMTNIELIKNSRDAAVSLLERDPMLNRHRLLKERLLLFQKQIHLE